MKPEEYKAITTELAYMQKELKDLRELAEQKPVEIHYHYHVDYGELVKILKEKGYIN